MLTLYQFLADASGEVNSGINAACGSSCNNTSLGTILGNITSALIFIVGAISVIMVVVGGLRYVLSSGDPKAAEGAKNTILYAIVGVAVAMLAYAIVTFATARFK